MLAQAGNDAVGSEVFHLVGWFVDGVEKMALWGYAGSHDGVLLSVFFLQLHCLIVTIHYVHQYLHK